MNGLSWLIYLADVSNDLDWLVWFIAFFSCVACLFAIFIMITAGSEGDTKASGQAWTFFRKTIWLALGSFFLSGLIPAKETVYAIAASELGESVLHSQTGNKAVQALDAWLDKQINADKPADDNKSENKSE